MRTKREFASLLGCVMSLMVLSVAVFSAASSAADISPFASTEDPAVQAMAAQAYADQFGVSIQTAYSRVELQDATAPLVDDLMKAIGVDYAGAWYDAQDGGKLKIGVADGQGAEHSEAIDAAQRIIAEAEKVGLVDFVTVEFSLDELSKAQEAVGDALATQAAAENVAVTIDVEHNAVMVKTTNDLTAADDAAVAKAVSNAETPVAVRQTDDAAFHAEERACALLAGSSSPSQLFCDPPLRGGVFMAFGGTASCTAGFLVFGNTGGRPFLMTAGHCLTAANGAVWNTRFADASLHAIGSAHSKVDGWAGDFGIIRIQNPSGWSATCCSRIWVAGVPGQTTQDSFYSIRSTQYAAAGTVVCTTSSVRLPSGYHGSCGTVATGTYNINGHAGLYGVSGMCAINGSSGGPVFKNHIAYGIVSASDADFCPTYYQAAPNAMSASNVYVN